MRPAVPGLLAAVALLFAGSSLANDPNPPAVGDSVAAESAETAQSAESSADTRQETPAEKTTAQSENTAAASSDQISLEEAAAQAQNVEVEAGKPFDPTKASRKEIEAYNAGVEPDQRFKCVNEMQTGSRQPTKVCLTQAQWRQRRN
ncbi:MAG TPA: hypothetical protein VFR59_06230 [Steroidobacteraceae bacterium]|nr:hypothetical protein [Steroidobacteraceae bacterium]